MQKEQSLCVKENFKRARQRLGLSQRALAKCMQTSLQTVSNYETGRVVIPGYRAVCLRRLLELHEGDRRSDVIGAAHSPVPSLDELFS